MALGDEKGTRVALSSGDVFYVDAELWQVREAFMATDTVSFEDRLVYVRHVTQLTYGRVPSIEKLEKLYTLEEVD